MPTAHTYHEVITHGPYSVGIFDRCEATIERRDDGARYRVTAGTVRWRGNTGGYHRAVRYLDRLAGETLVGEYTAAVGAGYETADPLHLLIEAADPHS